MLGAAQADGLGAKLERELCVLGIVGVDAHMVGVATGLVQTDLVGPGQDGVQVAGELGGDQIDSAIDDDAWVPSMEMTSPSCSTRSLPSMRTTFSAASMWKRSTPQTQGVPIPRAITAAWLVLPPWLVRIPSAATMPFRSSGLVSQRTKMTL